MFENPFYNSNQEKIDEKIKSAISSLRSEIQSLISARISKTPSEVTIVKSGNSFSEPSNKKETTVFSESVTPRESPQFNYTTDAKYNGEDVRFTISGQVLTPEEEAQFGDINYIDLGGDGSCNVLNLYTKNFGTAPDPIVKQVWVDSGSVGNEIPSGFDPLEGKLIAQDGFGYVWVKVDINEINGEITAVSVDRSETIPADTNTTFYYLLGYYKYEEDTNGNSIVTISNYGCGSLNVEICRQWFVLNPPFYKVNIYR